MSIRTTGLAAVILGLALTGAARADREPTAEQRSKIEAMLRQEGFTQWKKIEVDDDEIDVDDALDANGKQFDLELDPKTYVIRKREAE